jgi:hypothetical protein
VTHIYNPSYSGSSDQEDPGSKPAHANTSWDLILKNLPQKKKKEGGRVAQSVGPEFKPQFTKQKKKYSTLETQCRLLARR